MAETPENERPISLLGLLQPRTPPLQPPEPAPGYETPEDERSVPEPSHTVVPLAGGRRPSRALLPRGVQGRIRAGLSSPQRVTVLGVHPSSGRTTTALALGDVLAGVRGEPVAALDAVPVGGALAGRAGLPQGACTTDLLGQYAHHQGDAAARPVMSGRRPSGVEVLGSEYRPGASAAFFGADAYRWVSELLTRHYPLVVVDTPAGLSAPVMEGVLPGADMFVLTAVATSRSAGATWQAMDGLLRAGYRFRTRQAVLVVSPAPAGAPDPLDPAYLATEFGPHLRRVVVTPADAHLSTGGPLDPQQLDPVARDTYLTLAAAVMDGLVSPRK